MYLKEEDVINFSGTFLLRVSIYSYTHASVLSLFHVSLTFQRIKTGFIDYTLITNLMH